VIVKMRESQKKTKKAKKEGSDEEKKEKKEKKTSDMDEKTKKELTHLRLLMKESGLRTTGIKDKTPKQIIKRIKEILTENGLDEKTSLKAAKEYKLKKELEKEQESLGTKYIIEDSGAGKRTRSTRAASKPMYNLNAMFKQIDKQLREETGEEIDDDDDEEGSSSGEDVGSDGEVKKSESEDEPEKESSGDESE